MSSAAQAQEAAQEQYATEDLSNNADSAAKADEMESSDDMIKYPYYLDKSKFVLKVINGITHHMPKSKKSYHTTLGRYIPLFAALKRVSPSMHHGHRQHLHFHFVNIILVVKIIQQF